MVVAGTVEIVGSIDIESVKHGLSQLKQGLDEARNASRSAFGDLKRMGSTISGIAGPLAKIGATLGTTILGIAAMSPAIAPVMARMQADFLLLSRILGEELKPVFESVSESFRGFVDWLGSEEGRGAITSFGSALQGAIDMFGTAFTKLDELNTASGNLFNTLLPPEVRDDTIMPGGATTLRDALSVTGLLGAIGLTAGGMAAGATGAVAGGTILAGGAAGYFGAEALLGQGGPLNFLFEPLKTGITQGPDAGMTSLIEKFFDTEAITNQLMKLVNISPW